MPGHLLTAICTCGFRTSLAPGFAERNWKSHVIAYTADQSDLITIDEDIATRVKLVVVDDPALNIDPLAPCPHIGSDFNQGWGPYFCPSCKKIELRIFLSGYWD